MLLLPPCSSLFYRNILDSFLVTLKQFFGPSQKNISWPRLAENTAGGLTRRQDYICPVLASLYWSPVCIRTDFRIWLITFKALSFLSSSQSYGWNAAPLWARAQLQILSYGSAACSWGWAHNYRWLRFCS